MNPNQDTPSVNRVSGAVLGYLVACVIVIVLVVGVKWLVHAPAIDAGRAEAISKALAQIRTSEDDALNHAGWLDKPHGLVRLPIATAMQIAEHEWQHPAQARADLIAREDKVASTSPGQPAQPATSSPQK